MTHVLLYLLSIFSLSQAANLVRWTALPPEVIGFWRLLGAGLLLLPFAAMHGLARPDFWRDKRRLGLIALTGVFFFAHLWTYFYAAQNTRIANCMILFATNPLFTAAGAWLLFRENFPRRLLVADLLAFGGIALLVSRSLSLESERLWGDLSALVSALFFSGYLLASKKTRQNTGNLPFTALMYLCTATFFGLTTAATGAPPWPDRPEAWLGILATILLPTFLGHAVFTWLMNTLNLNWMSAGKLLEPLIAAAVAWLVFGEAVTPEAQAAFVCTGLAILLLSWKPRLAQKPVN